MNNLLQLKGTFGQENRPPNFGPATLPNNKTVTVAHLEKLKDDSKLSDISKTVSNNYTTYYECAVKNDAWLEWYEIQKNIYESLK
jgi:hypothetical protein